ncbi:Tetratricopeptide repeat-containing protein [Hyunsoonleella jejuensis]|uniref:Tetratricopeptide repeat-containing protein n=1 Tax=Hyunsoonleella jejuensis TaxID=419940 RepID=A0A1H9B8Z8_9FLAO|nr:tetratricopeptide repeat protein [Hyunsoonleella jejuensis]SEP85506.1 Tetratricopeptide repeat-containing protein [Hyunsoonleella jejuensis]
MKKLVVLLVLCVSFLGFSQDDKTRVLAEKQANNYVYEANELVSEDFVAAEMEYRKALSKQSDNIAGLYNLGNSYYEKGNFEEALYRHQQTAKLATSKDAKHKAFHNMGNVLMKNKKCKEAVEAYKSALRNNPSDDETRYNLALAKECAKQQEDENKDDENKEDKDNSDDKKDENKENKDDKNEENKDKKDGEDKEDEKKDGEDKEDEKKPEDQKEDKNKGDKEKEDKKKPQPKPGQLSPQQIKSLLEAMNNQEQKVQEKMNAEKQKGVKVKTEKDW